MAKVKVKTFDHDTFEELEIELDEYQLEVADKIKIVLDEIEDLKATPLLFLENQVCIGVFHPVPPDRQKGEKMEKYRIIIEKVLEE